MDSEQLEKYTSAITLSDMEIFVFPELMYSLVLADIMSPVIWQWRELDCFKKLEAKSSYRKLMRLKQFIMDEYEFNLDLETWGLTSKTKEQNAQMQTDFVCPEMMAEELGEKGKPAESVAADVPSQLSHWPIQLKLVSPHAPYFANADLLLVADCVPFAMGDFHSKFLKDHSIAVGCPKLDNAEFYIKNWRQY